MNILVLCTGNSARSILLEALLNHLGNDRVKAFSAGSDPAGRVHPESLRLLADRGQLTGLERSKSWEEFSGPSLPRMDAVITVCGSAASETCPIWPGAPVRAHWGVDDPAALPPSEWKQGFAAAYELLERRARALLALPIETMDRAILQDELTRIGSLP